MQVDSGRPVIFQVVIDPAGLQSTAPSNGFIDPTTIKEYKGLATVTGSTTNPTVTNLDTIEINGISVQFTSAGGLNLAGIVSTINALSSVHRVVAASTGSRLVLTNQNLYENYGVSVTGSSSVLAAIGHVAPTITYAQAAGATDLASSLIKERANRRWDQMVKNLSDIAINIGGVDKPGATANAAATSLTFRVAVGNFNDIYTYDESNNNALLKGIPALRQIVARGLLYSGTVIDFVNDPTLDNTTVQKGDTVTSLTIGALATSNANALAAISVTLIDNLR